MEAEQNRYCSVGGNGLKLYSNGRLYFYTIRCDKLIKKPVTRSFGTPDNSEPFTLYLFATESDKSDELCPMLPPPIYHNNID